MVTIHMSSRNSGRGGRRVRELAPEEIRESSGEQSTDSPGSGRKLPAGSDRVRHFDQLDGGSQRAFLRSLRGKPANLALPAGTVVVFTGYYRVERT